MRHLKLWACLAFCVAAPAYADVTAGIADGTAWTAAITNGPKIVMAFNPDGTGQVVLGPTRRQITWTAGGQQFCIDNLPRSQGQRCFEVQPNGGGYQLSDDRGMIMLTR